MPSTTQNSAYSTQNGTHGSQDSRDYREARAVLEMEARPPYYRAIIWGLVLLMFCTASIGACAYFLQADYMLKSITPTQEETLEVDQQAVFILGVLAYVASGIIIIFLLVVVVAYKRYQPLMRTKQGRLPLSLIVVVGLAYAFAIARLSGFSLWLLWTDRIPKSTWNNPAVFLTWVQLYYWFGRALAVLPVTGLMLRLVFIYYGWPQLCPPAWIPPYAPRLRCLAHRPLSVAKFTIVMSAPCIFGYVYTTVLYLVDRQKYFKDPVEPLLHVSTHLLYSYFDMWVCTCLFLLRKSLAKYDLDQTRYLIVLSFMWVVIFALHYARYVTRWNRSRALWPNTMLFMLQLVQAVVFFVFIYKQMRGMIKSPRPHSAASTTGQVHAVSTTGDRAYEDEENIHLQTFSVVRSTHVVKTGPACVTSSVMIKQQGGPSPGVPEGGDTVGGS